MLTDGEMWVNDRDDVVWIIFNDDENIEITPEAFEDLLIRAGFVPA